jgi:phage repressor protein C with HTH and peptisase S24 domain
MSASTYRPPQPISEVREQTREWLNHVCQEQFGGNVRRMAITLGYDDAGRSKLDRILKKKTLKIDPRILNDVKEYLREEGIEFIEQRPVNNGRMPSQDGYSLDYCTIEVARRDGDFVAEKAGHGSYVLDASELDETIDSEGLFVVPVSGDSMDPEFRSGDKLIVEPIESDEGPEVPTDGIYVFRLEDSLQVKRLQRLPNRRLRVLSSNEKYPAFEINLDAAPDLEVIGRVWARVKRY